MITFRESSLVRVTMNLSQPSIAKGNKLLLPKIEYARLTEAQGFGDENIEQVKPENEKNSEEFANLEKVPVLNNGYDVGSFTRFSVLPPIKGNVRGTRRLSHTQRFSTTLFAGRTNGPSLDSNFEISKKQNSDLLASHKRRGSHVVDDRLMQSLQVVGKHCVSETRQLPSQGRSNTAKQKLPRSFSSPTSSACYDSNCKGGEMILMRRRSQTERAKLTDKLLDTQGDSVVLMCNKKENRTGPVFGGINSDDSLKSKLNNSNNQTIQLRNSTLSPNPHRTEKLHSTFRPVSRCEISIDVNEGGQGKLEKRSVAQPLKNNQGNIEKSSDLANNDEETKHTQGTPRIQILIDSIDNAKEELPKAGGEVPYTSVREQRRRSALCRNNSKQVDDFLLVHNLRDLGLL